MQQELIPADLRFVAQRLPKDVRELLSKHYGRLFVGGGFIRATVAGEEPSDIDLFGIEKRELAQIADALLAERKALDPRARIHTSDNAITVVTPDRLTVQFITRWTFDKPTQQERAEALVNSFDFTVCQAALWRCGNQSNSPWRSATAERFYVDLAARRLVYTNPVREEEAGGSLLRVLKYVKRGYSIQVTSLGAVMARMADKIDFARTKMAETVGSPVTTGRVLTGMLREVDPLMVIDGFDVVDDHEPVEGEGA